MAKSLFTEHIDSVMGTPDEQPSVPASPLTEHIDAVMSSSDLSDSLRLTVGTNPDEAAKAKRLSKELDIPEGILPPLQVAEQEAFLKRVNPDQLKQDTPATANFLTNPDNARIVGRDVESLAKMEKTVLTSEQFTERVREIRKENPTLSIDEARTFAKLYPDSGKPKARSTTEAVLKDPLKAAASGVNRFGATMIGVQRMNPLGEYHPGAVAVTLAQRAVEVLAPSLYKDPRQLEEDVRAGLLQGEDYWAKQKSEDIQERVEKFNQAGALESVKMLLTDPGLMVDQLSQSAVYILPPMAYARGGVAATYAGGAAMEALDAALTAREEAREAGLTLEEQDRAANTAALITAPIAFLGNKLARTGVLETEFFTKGTIGGSLLEAIVREGIAGGVEEAGNTFGVNVSAQTYYDPTRQLLQGVPKSFAVGSVLEATHGAGMSAVSNVVGATAVKLNRAIENHVRQEAQARRAQDRFEALRELSAQATENGVRTRSAETFREFVDTMTEGQSLEAVYVAPATLRAALADPAIPLDQITSRFPELMTAMQAAEQSGTDVEITTADYLTYLAGTPVEEKIIQELRTEPGGMTYSEANTFYQEQRKVFEEAATAVVEEVQPVLTRQQFEQARTAQDETVPAARAEGEPQGTPDTDIIRQAETYEEYLELHKNKEAVRRTQRAEVENALLNDMRKLGKFPASMNRAYVAPLVAFYETQAREMGISPRELYTRLPLRVTGTNFAPETVLSQTTPATSADFRPDKVADILKKDNWAILTAENPNSQQLPPEENAARMAELLGRLQAAGFEHMVVEGFYDRPENSVVVFGISQEDAAALGREYGQESVLTREGFVYQDGSITPTTGDVEVFDVAPDNYYSTIRFPDGAVSRFSVGLDFDTRLQPGEVRPIPVERVGALGQTQTPEFKRWFGDSKVVDADGNPLVVYHGTRNSFSAFDTQMQGENVKSTDVGFFFTDSPAEASAYADPDNFQDGPEDGGNVMPAYLSMRKPLEIDIGSAEPALWYDINGVQAVDDAEAGGYDGVIIRTTDVWKGEKRPHNLYVAFSPTQIKSAIGNNGQFDPANPSIVLQDSQNTLANAPSNTVPTPRAREARAAYLKANPQLRTNPVTEYVPVNQERAARIAEAYEQMEHNPSAPDVAAAYEALIRETLAQYEFVLQTGLKIEFIPEGAPDPYAATPRLAIEDVQKNNHLWVFPTRTGFGTLNAVTDNPLLAETPYKISGQTALANDIFRVVHDYFGHIAEGIGFRATGEENAWRLHSSMYTPLARKALTTETRGQNSWVNFGPYGEQNRTASGSDTVYADQKVGLLPDWVVNEGSGQETRAGAVSVIGVHFSRAPREILSGSYFGTGIKGAEAARVAQSRDSRIKSRLYFYVDEGKGVFPEGGVGRYKHTVTLTNLYDGARNPLKLPTKNADGETDMNVFESAVLDAGFSGYYVEGAFHRQGAVVLLGDASKRVRVPQPAEMYQSVSLRRGTETLRKYGLDPKQRYTTREVAAALEARQRSKYGSIAKDDRSPEARKKIARWMAEEVMFELDNPGASAVGWYSYRFQNALNRFSEIFPELENDPNSRALLTALIAITSDGQKVVSNFTQAVELYEQYRRAGNFDIKRRHQRDSSIKGNLEVLQDLLTKNGPEFLTTALLEEDTVANLKKKAKELGFEFQSSDYQAKTKLPLSAVVFGPKLGAFYANLMGSEGYLTMDRWWVRTFNRYRGILLNQPTAVGLKKFREAMGHPEWSDDETVSATVPLRNAYAARGFKDGTPLEKMANTIYKHALEELNQKPFSASDRTFMIESVQEAQKILKRRGVDMSIADIQAVLWYYEKRLYGDLGARESATVDYEDAAERVVENFGDKEEYQPVVDTAYGSVEERFWQRLEDFEGAVTDYTALPDSKGGKVLDVDVARELSEDYLADRTRAAEVHEPASAFIKKLFAQKLAEAPQAGEKAVVLFTAGGGGAGKSTAIQNATTFLQESQIVYDGTLANYESAKTKIEQALAAGKEVQIALVVREPVEAFTDGVLSRAMEQAAEHETGRVVRADTFVSAHRNAPRTVQRLAADYVNDPRVHIVAFDNITGASPVEINVADATKYVYNDLDARVYEALRRAYEEGRITQEVYDAVRTPTAEGVPSGVREGVREGVEGGGQEQSSNTVAQGPRGSYNLDQLVISLLQGADWSTMVHESGHFFLEGLFATARMPEATPRMKADAQKVLDWFGVTQEQWDSFDIEQKRPLHEQWAQSFERWAFEGVAPSLKLQPIFSRFMAWMKAVYKSMEDFLRQNPLAGKLNDEIRDVFSRLMASEQLIREAQDARSYAPLFKTAEEAGVPRSKFEAYMELAREAQDESIGRMQARSLRDMKWLNNAQSARLKELQSRANDLRKQIREEVSKQVMAEPVNQAKTFLRHGKLTDPQTGEVVEASTVHKISTDVLAALYPDGNPNNPDLSKLRGMTSKDGVDPDVIAPMFGFQSGDQMVRAIASAEDVQAKIEGLTDQRMLEEHGELVDERAIQRAVEESLHTEARARFMATGLTLLTKVGNVQQIMRAAKETAERVIGGKRVRDIKPAQYTAAETRANKEAIKAAAKNPQRAAEAQRTAILNNRLAKAAMEAEAEVDSALRYLKKFTREGTRKNLDTDYLEQIDSLLEPFDLRTGTTLRAIDSRTSLRDWMAQQEALGFEPIIDPELVAEARQKHYKNMTMDELRTLVDTVKSIEHLGRLKHKLLTAQDARDFQTRIAEARDSIARNANRTVEEKPTPNDALGRFGQFVRRMAAGHRKFASLIRELDGGKDLGVMANLLLYPMYEAGSLETDLRMKAAQDVDNLFAPIYSELKQLGGLYSRRLNIPGTDFSLTTEERIMFALNWGNDGNRQRLLDGGIAGKRALTLNDVQAVLDTLTREEWQFVQGVWDYFETYRPLIAEQERMLTGKTPEWVEPSEIETKFGTMRGGYFPAKYDTNLSTRSEILEAAVDLRQAMKGAFNRAGTRNGYAQQRAEAVKNRPLLLSFDVISRHVHEVTHRIAWQAWLVDASRVLDALDPDIRQHLGVEALQAMREHVRDVAQGDAPVTGTTDVVLKRIRTGTSIVGMGYRVATALLQPAGITQSWARLGIANVMNGIVETVKDPAAAYAFITENSAFMRNRGKTMNREINEIVNQVRAGKKLSALQASYFFMITKMQLLVDIPTYLGAYNKALSDLGYEQATSAEQRAKIEKKAHSFAGQTVIDTQTGGEIKDLSNVQKGGQGQKLFTNFYSFFSALYNLNVENFRTKKLTDPVQFADFVATAMLLNVVPAIYSVILRNILKGECDWDDAACLANRYKTEQMGMVFGQIIGVRELGAAVDVATGGDYFGSYGPPSMRFFSEAMKLGVQLEQGDADMALFKAANNTAGIVFHYPAGQINTTLEGMLAIENGEVEGADMIGALISGPPR